MQRGKRQEAKRQIGKMQNSKRKKGKKAGWQMQEKQRA